MKYISYLIATVFVCVLGSCAQPSTELSNTNMHTPMVSTNDNTTPVVQKVATPSESEKFLTSIAQDFHATVSLSNSIFSWEEGRENFVEKVDIYSQSISLPSSTTFLTDMQNIYDFETAGAVDLEEEEPKIWKLERYPLVCLATFPTLPQVQIVLACGELPESYVYGQPSTVQAFPDLLQQIAPKIKVNAPEPSAEYFRWYDKDNFNKEYIVKGMSVVYPQSSVGLHQPIMNALEELGYTKTTYEADGPFGEASGMQKGAFGCLVETHNAQVFSEDKDKRELNVEATKSAGRVSKLSCSFVK